MQSKIATFIMSTVIFLIICVFILFGIIIFGGNTKIEFGNTISTAYEKQDTSNVIQNNVSENIPIQEETNETQENTQVEETKEDPFDEIFGSDEQAEQEEQTNQQENQYSNVIIDRYFYNQLENYSKIVYQALEVNKENMKTGNYTIQLGNSFDTILNQDNGDDVLGKYFQSALEAYTYDNPEIFYLNPNKMYLNIETITRGNKVTYNVFINSGLQENYFIDDISSKEQIDNEMEQIEQVKDRILQNKTNDVYKNIKMVHDYLIDNIEYDTSVSKQNIYNIYGAMVNGVCVCEGYARSFKYIMDELRNTLCYSYWARYKFRKN